MGPALGLALGPALRSSAAARLELATVQFPRSGELGRKQSRRSRREIMHSRRGLRKTQGRVQPPREAGFRYTQAPTG